MQGKYINRYWRLAGNIGVFSIANGASKIAPFVLVPILTRELGAEEYGLTDLFATSINLLVPLLTLSVGSGVLRFCIDPSEEGDSYYRLSVYLTAASCLLALALTPLLHLPLFGTLGEHAALVLASYAAVAFSTLFSNAARAAGDNSAVIAASCVSMALNLVLTIGFVSRLKLGITGFLLGYFISNLASCAVYLLYGRQGSLLLKTDVNCSLKHLHSLLSYSIPLVPNSLCWWITNSINRFFIASVIGLTASGIFAAASKLPALLNVASGIFQQAWTLSAFQEHGNKDANRFNSTIYRMYCLALLLLALVLIIFANPIAHVVLGKGFQESWKFMPLLLVSFYSGSIASFVGTVYTSLMDTKKLLYTTALGAGSCLLVTWLLIEPFGIQGVCVAAALSNTLMCVTRILDINKDGEYSFRLSIYIVGLLILTVASCAVIG